MRKCLKDIADIRTGYQFRGKLEPEPPGRFAVIQIKDIDENLRLKVEQLARFRPDRSPERYLVEPGDVLFLSRGHRMFAAAIEEPPPDTVATSYFFILRPKREEVRSGYLAWYLNQPVFQAELSLFVRGTSMPLISKSDIERFWIEVPPLNIQDTIAALDELSREERRLVTEIQAKRTGLIRAICEKAIRGNQ
jgi:restriction endonuclease S subunit